MQHPRHNQSDTITVVRAMGHMPGSVILSIDAVALTLEHGIHETFYSAVNTATCLHAGLTNDPEAVEWWRQQTSEERSLLREAMSLDTPSVQAALLAYDRFVYRQGERSMAWSLYPCASLIEGACAATGAQSPFAKGQTRCLETLDDIAVIVGMRRDTFPTSSPSGDVRALASRYVRLMKHLHNIL